LSGILAGLGPINQSLSRTGPLVGFLFNPEDLALMKERGFMATQVNNIDHWILGLCFVPVMMALTYYYPMLGAILVLVLTCFSFAKKDSLIPNRPSRR